jgi:hypothetical protein
MKKVSLFILFVMLCSMVVNAQTKVGDKIGGGVVISGLRLSRQNVKRLFLLPAAI